MISASQPRKEDTAMSVLEEAVEKILTVAQAASVVGKGRQRNMMAATSILLFLG